MFLNLFFLFCGGKWWCCIQINLPASSGPSRLFYLFTWILEGQGACSPGGVSSIKKRGEIDMEGEREEGREERE